MPLKINTCLSDNRFKLSNNMSAVVNQRSIYASVSSLKTHCRQLHLMESHLIFYSVSCTILKCTLECVILL